MQRSEVLRALNEQAREKAFVELLNRGYVDSTAQEEESPRERMAEYQVGYHMGSQEGYARGILHAIVVTTVVMGALLCIQIWW